MVTGQALVRLRDVVRRYPVDGGEAIMALDGVTLDVAAGAAVALAAVALYAVAAIARPAPATRATGRRRSPVEALGAPR
jgi:hypothetical protein